MGDAGYVRLYISCLEREDSINCYNRHFKMLHQVRAEYFHKLSKMVENKIDVIGMVIEENVLSEYGIRDQEKDNEQWEWSYLLDDLYYNSGKVVISQYRPDPTQL